MKKYFVLLSLMAFVLTSCEGPMGPPGEPGGGMETYYFTVTPRDWKLLGGTQDVSFYQCIKDLDIGSYIYENGTVSAYMYQMEDQTEVQTPLPYIIPHTDGSVRWNEQYTFDFEQGTVSFYVDYIKGETPPAKEFRVVLTW
ncbi:MAG: hypothetical protein LBT76_06565 [Tannerella sp.]|jgi:hypothetical protein|nr:hypothetical protein [Tannerella sp.]